MSNVAESACLCPTGVAEADSLVLVVDGQSGLHPSDEEVVAWLRQNHPQKPVILAVNKCESSKQGPTQVGLAGLHIGAAARPPCRQHPFFGGKRESRRKCLVAA